MKVYGVPHVLFARQFVSRKPTQRRMAESYELSLCIGGSGTLYVNDRQFALVPGAIRFTRPGDQLFSDPGFTLLTVYFHCMPEESDVIQQLLEEIPGFFNAKVDFSEAFSQLVSLEEQGDPISALRRDTLLLQLLLDIYESIRQETAMPSAVRECMEYMEQSFSDSISLETLGAITGYSPNHVHRLFKQSLGISPHEYLTRIRLRQGKKLLTESDLSLAEIAGSCGFQSESHFKTLFRRQVGMPPAAYRRNSRRSL